ncbi:MAG: cytochrome c [Deltaproteobacteria bacterium]|nr:MAG: cytochrome c [Deltaproteobacteria bacterium]
MTRTFSWLSIALLCLTACGDAPDSTDFSSQSDTIVDSGTHSETEANLSTDTLDDPSIERGQVVYRNRCSSCHGMSGTGGTGPNLDVRVPGLTEAELRSVIRDGSGSMQGVGASINDFDLDSLVLYLIDTHG